MESETIGQMIDDDDVLEELSVGHLRHFSDWPDDELKQGPPGI